MPRTMTTTVYLFAELSDAAKEKARDWYREGNPAEGWSEYTLADATNILEKLGYFKPQIFYNGFWSQGDGACFTGSWYARDCDSAALKVYAPQDAELGRIADGLAALKALPDMRAGITHHGHYYHDQSVRFEFDYDESDKAIAPDVAAQAEEAFTDLSRALMRWIYRTLETEYEYQNADAQVDDNIIANEYEFTAEGKRCVRI